MILIYNESSSPYESSKLRNSEFTKVMKKTSFKTSKGVSLRQAFILAVDDRLEKQDMSKYVNMNEPVILSHSEHKLAFGKRDLNPMIWAVDQPVFGHQKRLFFITLKNSVNGKFTIHNPSHEYYILEYAITREEFTVILTMNEPGPLVFTHETPSGKNTFYSFDTVEGSVVCTKKENTSVKPIVFNLKKFRPARLTEFILTDDADVVLADERIDASKHSIHMVNEENVMELVDEIVKREVRAITFYGKLTPEKQAMRDAIAKRFRIYYEVNQYHKLTKKKIL